MSLTTTHSVPSLQKAPAATIYFENPGRSVRKRRREAAAVDFAIAAGLRDPRVRQDRVRTHGQPLPDGGGMRRPGHCDREHSIFGGELVALADVIGLKDLSASTTMRRESVE
jgi:hypothetical protein